MRLHTSPEHRCLAAQSNVHVKSTPSGVIGTHKTCHKLSPPLRHLFDKPCPDAEELHHTARAIAYLIAGACLCVLKVLVFDPPMLRCLSNTPSSVTLDACMFSETGGLANMCCILIILTTLRNERHCQVLQAILAGSRRRVCGGMISMQVLAVRVADGLPCSRWTALDHQTSTKKANACTCAVDTKAIGFTSSARKLTTFYIAGAVLQKPPVLPLMTTSWITFHIYNDFLLVPASGPFLRHQPGPMVDSSSQDACKQLRRRKGRVRMAAGPHLCPAAFG